MSKELYNMQLHETFNVSQELDAVRVPGGWIYQTFIVADKGEYRVSACFVPYHNEFDDRTIGDLP